MFAFRIDSDSSLVPGIPERYLKKHFIEAVQGESSVGTSSSDVIKVKRRRVLSETQNEHAFYLCKDMISEMVETSHLQLKARAGLLEKTEKGGFNCRF